MIDVHARNLAHVLEATPNELTRRAEELFERESGRSYPAPLVLCGAGRLGRDVAAGPEADSHGRGRQRGCIVDAVTHEHRVRPAGLVANQRELLLGALVGVHV